MWEFRLPVKALALSARGLDKLETSSMPRIYFFYELFTAVNIEQELDLKMRGLVSRALVRH